jgi:hypothetical protein
MIVGIDKAGHQESSARIHNLCILAHHQVIAFPHKSNNSVPDGNINPILDACNIDIYQPAIPDDQICRFTPHGSSHYILSNLV